jgi:hypothetical protein
MVRKKSLHSGKNNAHVGHQFTILIAIGQQYRDDIDRQEKTPEQQRAFLARPQSGYFEESGKVAIAVGNHIRYGVVVAEEKINQAECGGENQSADRDACLPGALD